MTRKRRRKSKPPARSPEPPLQPVYPEAEVSAVEPAGPPPQPAEAQPRSTEPPSTRRRGRRRRKKARPEEKPQPVSAERESVVFPAEAPQEEVQPAEALAPAAGFGVTAHLTPVAAPAGAAVQPARKPLRGVVVLAIGLPGSGKTSWFRRRGVAPLSTDMLRMLLFDDIAEQRYQDLVFSTLRYLLRARMIARMPWNYVDATNLSPRERRGWIKMAQEFGYEVQAVFFDVPLEVCQERNRKRGRIVPEDVMQRMAQKLRAPTFEEGFSKVTVVRVKRATAHHGAAPDSDPKEDPASEWEERYDSE